MKHITVFSEYLKEELVGDAHKDLIELVGNGDVNALDKYLDANGIDVDYDSGMIGRLAAKQGKIDIIKYLDEVSANLKVRRNLALKTALVYGQTEVAEYLIQNTELTEEEVDAIVEYVNDSEVPTPAERSNAIRLLSK